MDPVAVNRYAQALLDAASKHSCEEAVESDLNSITAALESSGLRQYWMNPTFADDAKQKMMDALGTQLESPLTVSFLKLLITKKRTELMAGVSNVFTMLLRKKRGIRTCQITLASEADESLRTVIEAGLKRLLGDKIVTEYSVRQDLIGGIRIKTEDKILDASFKTRIYEIRKSLLAVKVY